MAKKAAKKNPSADFTLEEPTSIRKRLKPDIKSLLVNLGKTVVAFTFQKWDAGIKSLIDAAASISAKSKPEQLAWRLVYTALAKAADKLLEEAATSDIILERGTANPDTLADKALEALKSSEAILAPDFFDHPENLQLLADFQPVFFEWLRGFGVPEPKARAITGRLESYFVFELRREWRANHTTYAEIVEKLHTPFDAADANQRSWLEYAAWLKRQVKEPMFDESFSLADIYVDLRGAYDHKPKRRRKKTDDGEPEDEIQRTCVDLTDHLKTWALNAKSGDAIRCLSGGPGSGKSSFCKIFAAEIADDLRAEGITTLFIPLHHFRPEESLAAAIDQFLQETGRLSFNPLDPDFLKANTVLLIFDGLDELSQMGHVGARVATEFVRALETALNQLNTSDDASLRILLTGRELVIQANQAAFRGERLLDVLPLCPPTKADEESWPKHGDQQLLEADQRDLWWEKYGDLTAGGYTKCPKEFKDSNLREITAQPLLNYLVALSKDRDRIQFDDDTSLNEVYEDLIEAVYHRGWAGKQERRNPHVGDLKKEDFFLILEEIAASAWHSGDARTTTETEIKTHLTDAGLIPLLEKVEKGAEAGITKLLVAFFFREADLGGAATESAFEFTHKSFGEYLTARRLVRLMARIVKERSRRTEDFNDGWDIPMALVEWAKITGPTRMDAWLFDFFVREVSQQLPGAEGGNRSVGSADDRRTEIAGPARHRRSDALPQDDQTDKRARQWRDVFHELFTEAVLQGTPMERIGSQASFQELRCQADHAEESLLAACHACVRRVGEAEPFVWPEDRKGAFGDWLHRVRGQAIDFGRILTIRGYRIIRNSPPVVLKSLAGLNFSQVLAVMQELSGASLDAASLDGARLDAARLDAARLDGASLDGASLVEASLDEASLHGATLHGASLGEASLGEASLGEASLGEASLGEASLGEASLGEASLDGARIRRSQLSPAQLKQIRGEPDWLPEPEEEDA
ncbi:MAG: hypothetical protein ACI8UO_001994 [Verrucomicrobiales bacterium]|jgi:hypothetical protein